MASGWHMSAAARQAESARMKGKKRQHRGHPMSASARAKLSARMKGKHHPHKGHALSSSTRAKISAALKGKHHKGHAVSASTREKISAALKKHWTAKGGGHANHRPRGTDTGGRRPVSVNSLHNLRHGSVRAKGSRAPVLSRAHHTRRFHSGTHRLISSHLYRKRTGLIHTRRKRHTRIKIRHTVRHHRVWRKRRRR